MGIHTPLEKNLGAPEIQGFLDFFMETFPGNNIPFTTFRGLVKCAELAAGHADIGVIDVSVHHKGDDPVRVPFKAFVLRHSRKG